MPTQKRPGSNPNQDSNPELKFYLAAIANMERTGSKRKLRLVWNQPQAEMSAVNVENPNDLETNACMHKNEDQTETLLYKRIRVQPQDSNTPIMTIQPEKTNTNIKMKDNVTTDSELDQCK